MTSLAPKIEAYNLAARAAKQTWAPVYRRIVPFVGKKIEKVDGPFTKAFREAIDEALPKQQQGVNACAYSSGWRVYIEFTACVPWGDHGAVYDRVSLNVGTVRNGILTELAGEPEGLRSDYRLEEVEHLISVAEQAQRIANEAKTACYPFGEYVR